MPASPATAAPQTRAPGEHEPPTTAGPLPPQPAHRRRMSPIQGVDFVERGDIGESAVSRTEVTVYNPPARDEGFELERAELARTWRTPTESVLNTGFCSFVT